MTAEVVDVMTRYASSSNVKVKNLALVFLAHRDPARQQLLETPGSSIEYIIGPAHSSVHTGGSLLPSPALVYAPAPAPAPAPAYTPTPAPATPAHLQQQP